MPDNNRMQELARRWLELNRITGNDEPLPEELQESTEERDEDIVRESIDDIVRVADELVNVRWSRGTTSTGVRITNNPGVVYDFIEKSTKEGLVKCTESGKEYLKSECVYSNYHGVFLHKDSKSYINDYVLKDDIIITNNKLVNTEACTLYNVFTEFEDGLFLGGGLTGYPDSNDNQVPVHIINTNNYIHYGLDDKRFNVPNLYIARDIIFVDVKLLDNDEFKELFVENYEDGRFYFKSDVNPKDKSFTEKRMLKRGYRKGNFIKKLINVNKPNTFVKTLNKKYTFGLEVETISGYLPPHTTRNVSFQAVHDGSLRDPETDHTYGKLK